MVATDNIEFEKRIVFHGKCPTCGTDDLDNPDIYEKNGKLIADVLCFKCLDTKGAEPFNELEMSNTATLEILTTPTKRQQLYIHVYQVTKEEDKSQDSIYTAN